MVMTRGAKRKLQKFATSVQPSEAVIRKMKARLNHAAQASCDGSTSSCEIISQRDYNVASNNLVDELVGDSSSCFPHRERETATSFNLTKIAERMLNNDDLVEVDSFGPDITFVSVKGYKVKPNNKTLLIRVLSKHGDIAANCNLGSLSFTSSCLDRLCGILWKLMLTDFAGINEDDLEGMMSDVLDLERANIDIGWLKKRLDDISKAKKAVQHVKPLSNAKQCQAAQKLRQTTDQLEVYTRELAVKEAEIKNLEREICGAERHILAVKDEVRKHERVISEFKTKLRHIVELGTLDRDLI